MTFELTPSLTNCILFAMENQTSLSVVDAKNSAVVAVNQENNIACDNSNFYSLPKWTSKDGYALLENFTNNLYSPLAREELRTVLESGRGVFRNFKNVLKAYPEVERKWHLYKNKCMKARIAEWYNELCEGWGLEKLEDASVEMQEETDELLEDDFEFSAYDSSKDKEFVERKVLEITDEYKMQFSKEVGDAISFLWQKSSSLFLQKRGFVCRTFSGETVGCILASFCPSSAERTVFITDFFVVQNYRGLGIGKELFSKCMTSLKENGVQWILLGNFIVPPSMEPLLSQWGFEKLGSGYVANIFKE